MRFGATEHRPHWLLVGLGLAVIAATYLFLILIGSNGLGTSGATGSSALITLTGYLVGAALIIWGVSRQFTTSTYVLIPLAIAINIVGGQLIKLTGLPLYLDSIGTVLVGVLVGPWAGAATGGLANIIAGLTVDPVALPFAVVAIVIGLLAGVFTRLGWLKRIYLVPVAGLITGVIAAFLSSPVAAYVYGGVTGTGQDALVAAFRAYGNSILEATTLQGLAADPLDKVVTYVVAYLIVVALPQRMRTRFSQSGANFDKLPQ
jgi:energy-coupling factor transport system substrate-specific component